MSQSTVSISRESKALESSLSLPTGLHQRNGVWQLRIGVPADLLPLYSTVDAFRGSLRTTDRAQAITKAHALIAQYRQTFDDQRAAELLKRAPPVVPLTAELVDYLTAQATRRPLALDDDLRIDPAGSEPLPPAEMLSRWHTLQSDVLALERADIAAGRLENTQAHAVADLDGLGVRVDWGTPDARKALLRIARARVKAWQLAVERSEGEPHDTPAEPVPPVTTTAPATPSGPVLTLRDVVPDWVTRTKAKKAAQQATERALTLWEDAVGAIPLDSIKRATGAQFVAFLLDPARPFGSSTAFNHAAAISTLVNMAVKVGMLGGNPLDLSFKVEGQGKRDAWTHEELTTLFESPLLRGSDEAQPLGIDPADARLWLWVMLWSGATAGEIAQARTQDVQTRDGVLCLRITPEAGTVKTKDRERWLPIAKAVQPHLLAHLETRKERGDTRLFPSFHGRAATSCTSISTKWFRGFRTSIGLPAGRLEGSHKFRHTIRTKFAELDISPDIGDQVTGHAATGSQGRVTYTGALSPVVLLRAIERLEWQWPRRA